MGYYINPKDMTKELWLEKNSSSSSLIPPDFNSAIANKSMPVCLVDNGLFTAAGIAYDEGEFEAFNMPEDDRHKRWFVIPIDRLIAVGALPERFRI